MFAALLDYLVLGLIGSLTVLLFWTFEDNRRKAADKLRLQSMNQSQPVGNGVETDNSMSPVDEAMEADNFFSSIDNTISSTRNYNYGRTAPSMAEYNILLLGETGSGKSTTINAIANYLLFSTFDEAADGNFVEVISSRFTLPDPKTGKSMVIKSGVDNNENMKDVIGKSSTIDPKGHLFVFGDKLIRIIDTPGIGDTQGADADKKNFEQILNYLHYHKNLHGICILVKSTETRKTTHFQYCINELLAYLHKSECHNIVFCFTMSRNSFYGPGEGYAVLNSFLEEELKEVQIDLNEENCFYIDNEAYRFLVAKKQGYKFKENQEKSFKESWNISVEQVSKMMTRFLSSEPHNLEHTESLNNARKLILELAEPMVRLQNDIEYNSEHFASEMERLEKMKSEKNVLEKKILVEGDYSEPFELEKPTTVCTSDKCTGFVEYQGKQMIHYKTKCHVDCQLTGVTTNTVNNSILQNCWAMNNQLTCVQVCGCPWEKHMHLKQEYRTVKKTVVDSEMEKKFKTQAEKVEKIEEYIKKLQTLVNEYKEEVKVLQDISSKFACILIANSNTPYNKFFEPYLNLLIDEETKKRDHIPDYDESKLDQLKKMRDVHREKVRTLTEAIQKKKHEKVRIEDVVKYRDQLYNLKHSGPQLKKMMTITNATAKQSCKRDLAGTDHTVFERYSNPVKPKTSFGGKREVAVKYAKKGLNYFWSI